MTLFFLSLLMVFLVHSNVIASAYEFKWKKCKIGLLRLCLCTNFSRNTYTQTYSNIFVDFVRFIRIENGILCKVITRNRPRCQHKYGSRLGMKELALKRGSLITMYFNEHTRIFLLLFQWIFAPNSNLFLMLISDLHVFCSLWPNSAHFARHNFIARGCFLRFHCIIQTRCTNNVPPWQGIRLSPWKAIKTFSSSRIFEARIYAKTAHIFGQRRGRNTKHKNQFFAATMKLVVLPASQYWAHFFDVPSPCLSRNPSHYICHWFDVCFLISFGRNDALADGFFSVALCSSVRLNSRFRINPIYCKYEC